jgi:hypothetical protein
MDIHRIYGAFIRLGKAGNGGKTPFIAVIGRADMGYRYRIK